ncbi:hypothetical protein B4096_1637 [Heyndrickxia coagulans]|nr:hypothetical protein B4096_1637 [Heyndrickxia coagulans]
MNDPLPMTVIFIAPSPLIHPIPPFQVLKLFRFYYTTFLK